RGLGEIKHPGARGARVAHRRHALPHVGDDLDDRAWVSQLSRAFHPLDVALARDEKAAGEIGPYDGIPALGRDVLERRGELAASVVDEAVDAAEVLEARRDRRLDGVFL